VAPAREIDAGDATLARQRGDHRGGVLERTLGDLLGREVTEIVEDARQLVGVAGPSLGRRLLELGFDRRDDIRA